MTFMTDGLYDDDPLTPEEREAFEEDLISFSDRELGLLGDIHNLNVLYAGGATPLWLEGLSQRIGDGGSLTAIEADVDLVEQARESLEDAGLSTPVSLVVGNVFEPPFASGAFDLVYSAGLFHELDVREKPAEDVLAALARVIRPGGRVATSDWVDMHEEPSPADLEWERMEAEAECEISGMRLHGIGSPERLIRLHEKFLRDTRWRVSSPYPLRHLDKLMLSEPDEPTEYASLSGDTRRKLLTRRAALKERIRREGYGRPATLYVEGWKNPPNG
jgi:SAM-dependent methyltransferase